jgi:hypothetical protein
MSVIDQVVHPIKATQKSRFPARGRRGLAAFSIDNGANQSSKRHAVPSQLYQRGTTKGTAPRRKHAAKANLFFVGLCLGCKLTIQGVAIYSDTGSCDDLALVGCTHVQCFGLFAAGCLAIASSAVAFSLYKETIHDSRNSTGPDRR